MDVASRWRDMARLAIGQKALRLFPRFSRLAKAGRRVDANSKQLLTASEPIDETPALRAIRHDPQSQPAAIGKRDDSGAGWPSDFQTGKRHVGV